jgi:hypothetical protein
MRDKGKNMTGEEEGSAADRGCLSRVPDPTFFHPGSRIPDPHQRI